MNLIKALVGFLLIFLYHVPRVLYFALLASYALAFHDRPTLTASPKEHLSRAKKILKRGRLSELLYAALEVRFALERLTQNEMLMAKNASNRMIDEHSPVKKVKNLRLLDPDSEFGHEFYFVSKKTGERMKIAEYKPLEKKRVNEIHGRLGALLHPQIGLRLGVPDDPWYVETRRFLYESVEYLETVANDNTPYFAYESLDHIEYVKK